ncbi:hypothetical protein EBX31_00945 [bacterium]|nr:hypothetical protein [bacterium]
MHLSVKSFSSDALVDEAAQSSETPSVLVPLGAGLVLWFGLIAFVFWISLASSWGNDTNPVNLRQSESDAPTSPSPEDAGIVPIGASSAATTHPVSAEVIEDSTLSLEEFYGPSEGPVFRTAVGVNFLQPWSARFGNQSIYSKTIFNPGIRYDLEAGYNVVPELRLSFEGDFIYNSIHSSVWGNDTRYGSGSLYQVPVLFNATYHYLSQGPARGYVGAGVGANWMIYQSGTVLTQGNPYNSYQWNFAWQFTTGFTWTLKPGLDLDIGYKCLSMPNPNFADFGTSHAMFNHSAEIGLAWRF